MSHERRPQKISEQGKNQEVQSELSQLRTSVFQNRTERPELEDNTSTGHVSQNRGQLQILEMSDT